MSSIFQITFQNNFICIIVGFYFGCQPLDNTAQLEVWQPNSPVPKSVLQSTKELREHLLKDPYRPAYHFAIPEGNGIPGDPNGAFYSNGRYHLMYLYEREGVGFSYGHISSRDLLHWRHHPDAIVAGDGDNGIFSGGGFVDDDGTAVLTYWEFMGKDVIEQHDNGTYSGRPFGIGIAISNDEHFDSWIKIEENPVIKSTHWGITQTNTNSGKEIIYGSADPSQIWKEDGRYYMLTGNLLVLEKFGIRPEAGDDSLKYQGDHLYLMASDDLKQWEYLHEFYESDRKWTDKTEDNMCPSFLPLPKSFNGGAPSDKHLLLFISHNKGCQYYIGDYCDKKFYPENHGRMTWNDNSYFAPEALVDNLGRQIMWAWVKDSTPDSVRNHSGWSGVYGLPRSLWLGEDGTLRMRPIKELTNLRYNEKTINDLLVPANTELWLQDIGHQYLELEITIDIGSASQAGVLIGVSENEREKTAIFYDSQEKQLTIDAQQSTINDFGQSREDGPFELKNAELLVLRVFVDNGIVEVYANDSQAVCRRFYPALGGTGVKLFAKGDDVKVVNLKSWELMPTNPF